MNEINPDSRNKPVSGYKRYLEYSTIGIEMAASIFIGYWVGNYLDVKLQTGPWLLILFLCAGFGAATKSVIRVYKKAKKDMDSGE